MMYYPKMQTIWKRDPKTHLIMPNEVSKQEFLSVREWEFTEKIDGMNIRIDYDDSDLCYGPGVMYTGRTGKAINSERMLTHLEENFDISLLKEVFDGAQNVVLFGEGYGGKIQKGGGLYREDNAFILFDVYTDGWWLQRESVEDIAKELKCECVPTIPGTTISDAVTYVRSQHQSLICETDKVAEGIVARSQPLLLFRDGKPLMWKLKVQDYINLGMIER